MKYISIIALSLGIGSLYGIKKTRLQPIEAKRDQLHQLKKLRSHKRLKRQLVIARLEREIKQYEDLQNLQEELRNFERHLAKYDSSSDESASSSSSEIEIDSEYEWRNGYGPEIYRTTYPPSDSEDSSSSDDEFYENDPLDDNPDVRDNP